MLSIEQAHQQQTDYQPNQEIRHALRDTTMVAYIGGVAVGKNHLMRESGLFVVNTETSRPYRPGDDRAKYTYTTNEVMLDAIEKQELVQYGVHLPNLIYGSRLRDYRLGDINAGDFWYDSVTELENKGFASVKMISVLAPQSDWEERLDTRFAERSPGYITDRLQEAKHSLRWSLAQHLSKAANHLVIINDEKQTADNIERIVTFANGGTVEPLTDEYVSEIANQMFATIKNYTHQRNADVA